jgi:hypothetical protein
MNKTKDEFEKMFDEWWCEVFKENDLKKKLVSLKRHSFRHGNIEIFKNFHDFSWKI